jgi:leucyl/phenylalanyl-tRNA--protein transferase
MTKLNPRLLLQGYATGIFPMAESRDTEELFWVEPRERAILPVDGFYLSRSLAKRLRSDRFQVTCDRDFGGVLLGCADRPETWINGPIERAMHDLHALGAAHSVEVWREGRLVGGIYGVKLGRAFFGESMFSRETDASKVALAWLVARLKVGGFSLLDCQFMTEHLQSLGAVSVSRKRYCELLSAALGSAEDGASGVRRDGPAFGALDRLLEEAGSAGADGLSGKVIAQLLTHTS